MLAPQVGDGAEEIGMNLKGPRMFGYRGLCREGSPDGRESCEELHSADEAYMRKAQERKSAAKRRDETALDEKMEMWHDFYADEDALEYVNRAKRLTDIPENERRKKKKAPAGDGDQADAEEGDGHQAQAQEGGDVEEQAQEGSDVEEQAQEGGDVQEQGGAVGDEGAERMVVYEREPEGDDAPPRQEVEDIVSDSSLRRYSTCESSSSLDQGSGESLGETDTE